MLGSLSRGHCQNHNSLCVNSELMRLPGDIFDFFFVGDGGSFVNSCGVPFQFVNTSEIQQYWLVISSMLTIVTPEASNLH